MVPVRASLGKMARARYHFAMGINDLDRTLASNRLVFDLRRDRTLRQRFQQNMEPVLDEYALSDAEKTAWRNEDIAWFAHAGVHPYFLPQISRLFHGTAYNHNNSEAAQVYARHMVDQAEAEQVRKKEQS
jgi:hypothetical protein